MEKNNLNGFLYTLFHWSASSIYKYRKTNLKLRLVCECWWWVFGDKKINFQNVSSIQSEISNSHKSINIQKCISKTTRTISVNKWNNNSIDLIFVEWIVFWNRNDHSLFMFIFCSIKLSNVYLKFKIFCARKKFCGQKYQAKQARRNNSKQSTRWLEHPKHCVQMKPWIFKWSSIKTILQNLITNSGLSYCRSPIKIANKWFNVPRSGNSMVYIYHVGPFRDYTAGNTNTNEKKMFFFHLFWILFLFLFDDVILQYKSNATSQSPTPNEYHSLKYYGSNSTQFRYNLTISEIFNW